jgi:ActR/RegA family two-component response regulator
MTTVLVVEDDTTFRSTLARDLGLRGHTVAVAGSVDEALTALAKSRFEVLLTDLRLGDRDGIDLLKRARTVAPATRSILMSGFASARDYQRAIELGAVRVLCKPFSSAELNQAIEHARDCSQSYSGNIHGLSLIDVLQLYQLGRRSIAIRVVGGLGGEILLRDGAFVHAERGELSGEPALIALLGTPSGVLRSETLPPTYTTTIERSPQEVLLDCLRQIDERTGDIGHGPRPEPPHEPDDQADAIEAAIYRLRSRWYQLSGDGPALPDTADVIGIDVAVGVSVQITGAGDPETWLEPLRGLVADIERMSGERRGAMQATVGRVQIAVLWDDELRYCFLISDIVTSIAGNAWFRTFATAVTRGVLAG